RDWSLRPMLRAPPTRSRFPYTTLFRSRLTAEAWHHAHHQHHVHGFKRRIDRLNRRRGIERDPDMAAELADLASRRSRVIHDLDIDRKSTRLNSSHVKRSYAVFCLKKKK